jgi:NAD-dependent dihydropyrimidine dehydrogenase PreA subunit
VTKLVREIIKIDEEKCDGCGLCVPSCAEGAIQIVDGKARLVGDSLCDGLGACLGTCPLGAITIERREADSFDEEAVRAQAEKSARSPRPAPVFQPCACPGSVARELRPATPAAAGDSASGPPTEPHLGHWPVQIHLLPAQGSLWNDADVLLAADCVPFAMPDFHGRLLAGKTVAVGCPKLDDAAYYTEKLGAIFASNDVRSVTVARMEVPCCAGLVMVARQALALAGKTDLPFHDVTIGLDGRIRR